MKRLLLNPCTSFLSFLTSLTFWFITKELFHLKGKEWSTLFDYILWGIAVIFILLSLFQLIFSRQVIIYSFNSKKWIKDKIGNEILARKIEKDPFYIFLFFKNNSYELRKACLNELHSQVVRNKGNWEPENIKTLFSKVVFLFIEIHESGLKLKILDILRDLNKHFSVYNIKLNMGEFGLPIEQMKHIIDEQIIHPDEERNELALALIHLLTDMRKYDTSKYSLYELDDWLNTKTKLAYFIIEPYLTNNNCLNFEEVKNIFEKRIEIMDSITEFNDENNENKKKKIEWLRGLYLEMLQYSPNIYS